MRTIILFLSLVFCLFFNGPIMSPGRSYSQIFPNNDNQVIKKKSCEDGQIYIECVCVHVALPKDKFIHTHNNLVNQQELYCEVLSQWRSPDLLWKSKQGSAHPAANGQNCFHSSHLQYQPNFHLNLFLDVPFLVLNSTMVVLVSEWSRFTYRMQAGNINNLLNFILEIAILTDTLELTFKRQFCYHGMQTKHTKYTGVII